MAGEIQLNSTTMATESSGTITLSNVNSATNRTNLGLGSMATQNANAVALTGGSLTGTEIDLKSSGTTIYKSDGTTAVLSESGGTVMLTADELKGEIISEPTSSAATSDLIGWMTSGTSSESVQNYSTPQAVDGSSVILPKGVFLVTAVAAMIRATGTDTVTKFSLDFLSSAPSSLLETTTNVFFTENGYAQATINSDGSRSHYSKIIEEYSGGTTYNFYAQINVTPNHAIKVAWKILKLR